MFLHSSTIDSGTVYTMNHNLGAVPLTATIWGATDSSGSEQYLMNVIEANSGVYGTWMSQVTSTAFTLKTGDNRWVCGSCYPNFAPSSSGYMKVFLSASPCGGDCYDSGWFAVSSGAVYTKTHPLGAVPKTAIIWASASADGSNAMLMQPYSDGYGSFMGGVTD